MKSGATSNPAGKKIIDDLLESMLVGGASPLSIDILSIVLANI